MRILDCTLRDGGYYNKWSFSTEIVNQYFKNLNELPIQYAEIGYRSLLTDRSFGELFNVTLNTLENAAYLMPNVKKAIMIDEKHTLPTDLYKLINPCRGYADMIRIAVSVANLEKGITLAKEVKNMGFETSINLLYSSEWQNDISFIRLVKDAAEYVDFFYLVDSYGSMEPGELKTLIKSVKEHVNIPLGFHGHNNLELALINSITAIDAGCEMIDSTILGMGRGAGNLKTELLLTFLSKKSGLDIQYENLATLVETFEGLYNEHCWGTNLAYMFSGTYSLHQNEVMSKIANNHSSMKPVINELIVILSEKNNFPLNISFSK